jgi:hypothetical protein
MLLYSEYALVSSGTCQSNNRYDVTQADCETAATSLGLSDTSAHVGSDGDRSPNCIYASNGWLMFNDASNDVACGTADGSHSYDCICGALGTGT